MEVNSMQNDWRLVNQENYLKDKLVTKANFNETESCDHVHCAFCWEKIGKGLDMVHSGYRVVDGPWWICDTCFHDFKESFGWILEPKDDSDGSTGDGSAS